MPNYERKNIPFLHRGMNWNAPVEKLAEGQPAWCKNVRVLEQGTVSSAHGYTFFGTLDPNYHYLHSISRLNVLNPDYDTNLARTYVLGADQELLVFQGSSSMTDPALNPVWTPRGQYAAPGHPPVFSGNPLSVIDAQPAGAAAAWKYIGDSVQMVTVGYYPSDQQGVNMARALTIGLPPPVTAVAGIPIIPVLEPSPGNLNGSGSAGPPQGYQWKFAFRRVPTGARSNPSAATRATLASPTTNGTNFGVSFQLPFPPLDPQTQAGDTNVVVDVYRFGGNVLRWALVGSGPGGSIFHDNMPDEQLLAAPGPPQVTDPITGLSRFNLYQPFVTQDIAHAGQATTQQMGNGTWQLWWTGGPAFNVNWLPGSTIYVDGKAFTIYQVISDVIVELFEDAAPNGFGNGQAINWNILAGTLTAGQPLPHLFGPYGVGQQGSYVFGCGDPNAPGTLYWTNGNDPDSTDIVNNIQVTSPSEKLMTGCVYDGQPFCWSTERQFQIFPSLTIFGQFTAQEVAGAKGVWMEWSLSVQSNGISDQSVTWRGKDGIYDWSSGGLQRLTDPLYAFFPHDNNPGLAPETIMPFIGAHSLHQEVVGNLFDGLPQYHRTCWFHGILFYDFVAVSGPGQLTYSTLVWDSVNIPGGGWVSLDQPFADTAHPVARGIEIGANDIRFDIQQQQGPIYGPMQRGGNLKVSHGGNLYDYYGETRGFQTRVITRAEDMGDPRANKLFGDYWLDCTPFGAMTSIVPLVNYHRSSLPANSLPFSGSRGEFVLDFVGFEGTGLGPMNQTLGLDITWTAIDGQFAPSLNQWSPSYVMKPETISLRASDRTDEGVLGAKYLMGMNLEANTFNAPLPLQVRVDGQLISTLSINHDGQSEHPYAWEPVAGYEFNVEMRFPPEGSWQLYKIQWIFEPWPDAIARKYPFQNLGTSGAKYIRGVVLPMETGGNAGQVGLWGDDDNITRTFSKTTLNLKKTGEVLDLPGPFVAHEIQFSTLTDCRIWPAEAKVDFDPWPEMSTDVSSFTNLGYQGSKFFQGVVFSAETGGRQVQITVNSDCGHSVTLPLVQTPALCKNTFAFSFSPCNNPPSEPFIASEVQIVPDGDIRIWNDETRYVWEPEPELVATWQTQPTDHDLAGWHSMRDCFIAYRGGSGAPTLYITTEYGTESYGLDYVGPNVYTRCYRVLKPQKAKWRSYRVEGCGLIRLYIKDCSVRVKEWGSTGPYVNAQPFGDLSRANGGARI